MIFKIPLSKFGAVKELAEELREDLAVLRHHVGEPNDLPNPAFIRATLSPILRKWICDDGLGPIHRAASEQSVFTVQNTDHIVKKKDLVAYELWHCEMPIAGNGIGQIRPKDANNDPLGSVETGGEVKRKFRTFRQQKIAYLNGKSLTRDMCLRYFADQMGGTHTIDQAKKKNGPAATFIEMAGFAFDPETRDSKMFWPGEFQNAARLRADGKWIFNFMHICALDTARRFHEGLVGKT